VLLGTSPKEDSQCEEKWALPVKRIVKICPPNEKQYHSRKLESKRQRYA